MEKVATELSRAKRFSNRVVSLILNSENNKEAEYSGLKECILLTANFILRISTADAEEMHLFLHRPQQHTNSTNLEIPGEKYILQTTWIYSETGWC